MKKHHLGLGVGVALLALVVLMGTVAWVAWGPKRTLAGVMEAVEQQDVARLNELVDFEAVRSQVKAAMLAEIQAASSSGDPYDQMGMALGMALVEPMLETFISAEGFIAIASGGQTWAEEGGVQGVDNWQNHLEGGQATLRFPSLSRAEVSLHDPQEPSVSLVVLLDRHGLNWRVVGGRLDTH